MILSLPPVVQRGRIDQESKRDYLSKTFCQGSLLIHITLWRAETVFLVCINGLAFLMCFFVPGQGNCILANLSTLLRLSILPDQGHITSLLPGVVFAFVA